ncbi:MAG: hypothetical protein O3C43_22635 [Verrucomicrobia bacterium]|nr:hypothetical protein [Verrucomicrobiota bacterium]MDA1069289.1 hypothetical protein [Verrucomicrobiota bacterium]
MGQDILTSIIYFGRMVGQIGISKETNTCPGLINSRKKDIIMGDKSPKSKQKNSSQKQAKVTQADAKKKKANEAKQVVAKKK